MYLLYVCSPMRWLQYHISTREVSKSPVTDLINNFVMDFFNYFLSTSLNVRNSLVIFLFFFCTSLLQSPKTMVGQDSYSEIFHKFCKTGRQCRFHQLLQYGAFLIIHFHKSFHFIFVFNVKTSNLPYKEMH